MGVIVLLLFFIAICDCYDYYWDHYRYYRHGRDDHGKYEEYDHENPGIYPKL